MNVLSLLQPVTTFVFDVDGVLTDGTVLVMPNGLQARRMHIKDGFALQMALRNGYKVKIISGGNSPEVADRLLKLGVKDISMQVLDKKKFLLEFMSANNLQREQVLFMGDDLPDIPAMQEAGVAACPADAVDEVKDICQYISPLTGGNACVRELIEKVLKLNGHWNLTTEVASR